MRNYFNQTLEKKKQGECLISAALLSFIAIVLFMIHEFEEVIWVVSWNTKNATNPTFAEEMFMLGKASYPSSETMALLILEEFVLASFILLIGIFLKSLKS